MTESDDRTIDTLRILGNSYARDCFTERIEHHFHYTKNDIPIGYRINQNTLRQQGIYYVNVSDAIRMICVGQAGSGKTFLLRGFMDRLAKSNYVTVQLSDIKNEFFSSRQPVQPKFAGNLAPNEKPQATKLVVFRPTFFKELDDKLPKDNYWLSFDINLLTRGDFLTLFNASEMPNNQKILMDVLYTKLKERLNKGEEFNMELLNSLIDEIDEVNDSTKQSLKFKLRPFETSNFYDKQYLRNIPFLLKKGYSIALNLEGFEEFDKSAFNFPAVLISLVHRSVVNARKSKLLKSSLFISMDESVRFIGNDKNTSVKLDILEGVDINRRYDVSYVFVTQFIKDLPEKILKQSRYILLPATVDTSTIRDALMSTGIARNQQYSTNQATYLKKSMMRVKYSWCILDRELGTCNIVKIFSPLSNHLETR